MKKENIRGFVLLETLIVTVFISGVLLFLFVQFNTLNNSYEETNKYNNVEYIYALNNIANYIKEDSNLYSKIESTEEYIDLTNCELFSNKNYCNELMKKEKIEILLVMPNNFNKKNIIDYDDDLLYFINKIQPTSKEKYRLVAKFNDDDFATVRFGDSDE